MKWLVLILTAALVFFLYKKWKSQPLVNGQPGLGVFTLSPAPANTALSRPYPPAFGMLSLMPTIRTIKLQGTSFNE